MIPMLYQRYQNARDAAWRTLLRFEIDSLPVDAERIAKAIMEGGHCIE